MCCKDNVFDQDTAKIVQEINEIKDKIEKLEKQLDK